MYEKQNFFEWKQGHTHAQNMETVNPGIGVLQVTEDDLISHSTDFFSSPATEISMLSGDTLAYRPVSLSDEGPYTFIVNPQGNRVLLLNTAQILIKVKLMKSDGTSATAADLKKVAPINSFAGSFIDKVDIQLDGNEILSLTNTHANYKHYVETLLSYGTSASSSHLQAGGFHMDSANQFDTADATNDGWKKRASLISATGEFTLVCPLHSDILHIDRQFPPGIGLSFIITRASDNFLLHATEDSVKFKIKVLGMKLFIRHLSLTDHITGRILSRMKEEPIILPFMKTIIKSFVFPSGLQNVSIPNAINGSLPKSILIFMTKENASSQITLNPYNFQHFNLSEAYTLVNGNQIPVEAYAPDFTNHTGAVREFRHFFDNIGILHNDHGNQVSLSHYKGGCFFLSFDLTPDLCYGFHKHVHQTGTVDLNLTFKTSLPHSIRVFFMSTFDAILQIASDKQCKVYY